LSSCRRLSSDTSNTSNIYLGLVSAQALDVSGGIILGPPEMKVKVSDIYSCRMLLSAFGVTYAAENRRISNKEQQK
jgi:hypothetical protein